jgi:hypothetical protein
MRPAPIAGPLVVAAHDAGGAEVVSSWIRRNWAADVHLVAEGPARAIFLRKLPACNVSSRSELPQLIRSSNFLLTGTSWGSDLEFQAIKLAGNCNIRNASFVDHWVNYPQRFTHNDESVLPTEIWLGDEFALSIAQRHFPAEILRLEPNPYFADIHDEFASLPQQEPPGDELRILYVSEPIADHFALPAYRHQHPGYDEYGAIANFFRQLEAIKARPVSIRFRLHPSEMTGKYATVLQQLCKHDLHYSEGTSLLQDCAWARWVVGCESMAMVIGLIAGKQVFTSIPPEGRDCQLPQPVIQSLNTISINHALQCPVNTSI